MRGGFRDWMRLARVEHAAMVIAAVIISEALAAKYAGIAFAITAGIIYSALGPFALTIGAFILNDYFGYETDKANRRKDRPIVAGVIARRDALKAAYVFYAIGLALIFFVNFYCFIVGLIFAILSATYDNYLKKLPLLGNMYIASSMSASFIYGNFAVTYNLQEIILLFVAISFLAGVGRELIITLRDVEGDRKVGGKTLPMVIGNNSTIALSAALFLIAMIISWVPMEGNYYSAYAILIYLNNFLLAFTVYSAMDGEFGNARNASLLALAVGLAAFGTLAL
ncbi:MAG: UbiA family prenyltransferase [Candidatus Micrarchaeota archaeon]